MQKPFYRVIDWFIPAGMLEGDSDRLMARTFVMLHLAGPLMGHSVTFFLAQTVAGATWQWWVTEAMVAGFFGIPFLLKVSGSMKLPAMTSVQMLVGLSLFGSFSFGGISSPLLPWFLIAMVLGFFYLAESITLVLAGIAVQIAIFIGSRFLHGEFPTLLAPEDLRWANTFSILAALAYMTMLALFYETVMRIRLSLEQETIDQRSKLKLVREAMEAAELASKRKSIFLAKMSHELRTPLNAVIGYAEMLRENFEDRDGATQKMQDLDRIHAAGRHLLALVNNVLDLSSIEANRVELTTEPIDVQTLVNEVIATASPLINKRDNRMIVEIPAPLGVIQLADNGIGMTPAGLRRIFQDFGQAENDTVSQFGGTGLGLALTQRFCQMMGGSIGVHSERGMGSRFTIRIPILAGKPAAGQGRADMTGGRKEAA